MLSIAEKPKTALKKNWKGNQNCVTRIIKDKISIGLGLQYFTIINFKNWNVDYNVGNGY